MKLLASIAVLMMLASTVAAADFDKGMAALDRRDYAQALKNWRPLAEQGDAKAQYYLGFMYQDGFGVPQDRATAIKWYRKSAGQGNVYALVQLGYIFEHGMGVPQDYMQAHMWFNLAAATGSKAAIKNRDIIAKRMTPADISKAQKLAAEWFERRNRKR